MTRLSSAISALVVLGAIACGLLLLVPAANADLDPKPCASREDATQVFTSRTERVRIVVPRDWCATETPSYPGLLLTMIHDQPYGRILLTSEPFTRELYCSWPIACRNLASNTAKYACALRDKLATQRMKVGPSQLGPKENEVAGLPSVWFEFEDPKRFLRQAVAVTNDRALSLVLSTSSADARAAYARPFDTALRTLQLLTAAESAAPPGSTDAAVEPADAVAELADGGTAAPPPPRESPIGPCASDPPRR